jgi:translation initiation factor 2 beta subunit (eIF-2beta)/eIF-5
MEAITFFVCPICSDSDGQFVKSNEFVYYQCNTCGQTTIIDELIKIKEDGHTTE